MFILVTILPLIRRLRHPTILGDDVTRIVDLVKFPFREHLFLPFAEHIAPLFQLVSWVTWELIGHDVRLAPLGVFGGGGIIVGFGIGTSRFLAVAGDGLAHGVDDRGGPGGSLTARAGDGLVVLGQQLSVGDCRGSSSRSWERLTCRGGRSRRWR